MVNIFISHASHDKDFSRRLATDLSALGHTPWLDEWEIKVGDCIIRKIEDGISKADHVVLVLSPRSVQSKWVEREWSAKYWEEIEKGQILLLPALIEDCEIPNLIKTKKYADFRKNYTIGFLHLADGISSANPSISVNNSDDDASQELEKLKSEILALIAKIQSGKSKLSQCIADALVIAQRTDSEELENFCITELSGLLEQSGVVNGETHFPYRLIEGFSSANQINTQYIGWGESASSILDFMKSSDGFYCIKILISFPISRVEAQQPADPHKQIMRIQLPAKQILPDYENPEQPVFIYSSGCEFVRLLSYFAASAGMMSPCRSKFLRSTLVEAKSISTPTTPPASSKSITTSGAISSDSMLGLSFRRMERVSVSAKYWIFMALDLCAGRWKKSK
jgi:hypothetical protein